MSDQELTLDLTCPICHRRYIHKAEPGDPPPTSCGTLPCRIEADYTPEEWSGLARMARARVAAGAEVTDIDRTAMARAAENTEPDEVADAAAEANEFADAADAIIAAMQSAGAKTVGELFAGREVDG